MHDHLADAQGGRVPACTHAHTHTHELPLSSSCVAQCLWLSGQRSLTRDCMQIQRASNDTHTECVLALPHLALLCALVPPLLRSKLCALLLQRGREALLLRFQLGGGVGGAAAVGAVCGRV